MYHTQQNNKEKIKSFKYEQIFLSQLKKYILPETMGCTEAALNRKFTLMSAYIKITRGIANK
jgi:hypothetical protein